MTIMLCVKLLRDIHRVVDGSCPPAPVVFFDCTRASIPGSGSHRHALRNKIPAKDFNHQMCNSRNTSIIEINLTKQIDLTRILTAFFLFPTLFWPRRRENDPNKLQGPLETTQAVMNLQERREHR